MKTTILATINQDVELTPEVFINTFLKAAGDRSVGSPTLLRVDICPQHWDQVNNWVPKEELRPGSNGLPESALCGIPVKKQENTTQSCLVLDEPETE